MLSFLLCITAAVYGQQMDSIENALHIRHRSGLFLQADKSMYTSGERIWFSAYAFDVRDTLQKMHSLQVVLVNDMSQSVVSEQRFVMDKGVGYGSVYVPDSIQTGSYSLMAYSNLFAEDPGAHNYSRILLDIIGKPPPFKVSFVDDGKKTGHELAITARVTKPDGSWPRNAEIQYTIRAAGEEVRTATVRANNYGEAVVNLPRKTALQDPEISMIIRAGKEKALYKMPLHWQSDDKLLKLVPETEHLIEGAPAKLYFQLTTTAGKGLSEKLLLLIDGVPVDSTASDLLGVGLLNIPAGAGRNIKISLPGTSGTLVQQFPEIITTGYAIEQVENDPQKDSLTLLITRPDDGRPFLISFYNNNQLFDQLKVVQKKSRALLSLSTKNWRQGLSRIAIHDEEGVLQCVKMVSLMPDTSIFRINITTDSVVYRTRSKVTVNISLKDIAGKPLQSLLTLSAVRAGYAGQMSGDIRKVYYFDRFMDGAHSLPVLSDLSGQHNLSYFLARRTTAAGGLKADPAWMKSYQPAKFDGWVTDWRGRSFKFPVTLSVKGNKSRSLMTAKDGSFSIPYEWLKADMKQKLQLTVSEPKPEDYRLVMDSTHKMLSRQLAAQYFYLPLQTAKDGASAQLKEEMQRSRNNTLEEVVVEAKKKGSVYQPGVYVSQTCMDWICMNGVFNCSNHSASYPGSRVAITGERYGGRLYICEGDQMPVEYLKPLSAINYGGDFSVIDFSNATTGIAPEMLERTTLYWEPALITDRDGKAVVSFYTNDVTGRFDFIIQGITGSGVIQSRISFDVKD